MVSLRRRRLLGLISDEVYIPMVTYFDDEGVGHFDTPIPDRVTTRPLPWEKEEIDNSSTGQDSLILPGTTTNSPKHQDNQENDQPAKPAKLGRRKNTDEEEFCTLRGVYFKNQKWQAAIKVEKRQVHLGTLETQADACRVYDRASFMRGRAPNYELPEEEKQELRQLSWEEFLEKTKIETTSMRKRKREDEAGVEDLQNDPGEGPSGGSSSEIAELE